MGNDCDVVCVENLPEREENGEGPGDDGVEKGNKIGPQQRIATALSGVIIQEILCAS